MEILYLKINLPSTLILIFSEYSRWKFASSLSFNLDALFCCWLTHLRDIFDTYNDRFVCGDGWSLLLLFHLHLDGKSGWTKSDSSSSGHSTTALYCTWLGHFDDFSFIEWPLTAWPFTGLPLTVWPLTKVPFTECPFTFCDISRKFHSQSLDQK